MDVCDAIKTLYRGEELIMEFGSEARLPVLLRNGKETWLRWGSLSETHPWGNVVWLDHLKQGAFDGYWHRLAKIPCVAYHELRVSGDGDWIDVKEDHTLIGLILRLNGEDRVYLLVRSPEVFESGIYTGRVITRWTGKIIHPKNRL